MLARRQAWAQASHRRSGTADRPGAARAGAGRWRGRRRRWSSRRRRHKADALASARGGGAEHRSPMQPWPAWGQGSIAHGGRTRPHTSWMSASAAGESSATSSTPAKGLSEAVAEASAASAAAVDAAATWSAAPLLPAPAGVGGTAAGSDFWASAAGAPFEAAPLEAMSLATTPFDPLFSLGQGRCREHSRSDREICTRTAASTQHALAEGISTSSRLPPQAALSAAARQPTWPSRAAGASAALSAPSAPYGH